MIKKLFSNNFLLNTKPSQSIISAAFVISMAGVASRILGLFRDRLLASTFGAGDTLDVYYAAFRVPDLIYNLLILGALSAAFIPVFTSLISKGEDDKAWEMANGILNIFVFFIIIFSVIFAIFAPFLMKIITPGFPAEKMTLVVSFTRIMFLSPLFLGISGIFGGILTSFKKFLIYSIAPVLYNLGIILGVLFFVRFMGPIGLAWGVVFGAFLHMIAQYPAAKYTGFKYKPIFFALFADKSVKKVLVLMVPRVMGIAINQINLMVITIFASMLAAGSLAIFNFAQNLQSVPLGLIGISFSVAVFPILSRAAANGNNEEFSNNFSYAFRQILFFIIPLSVLILVLRAQIVRVVLGSGKFDWEDTILTFQCLGFFAASLFAQCTVPLLARSFYALHDTKTPFYIAIITEIVNISLVLILISKYKILGLAIAFSLAGIVQMLLLLMFLHVKLKDLDDKRILKSVVKISIASFFAGLSAQFSKYLVSYIFTDIDTFFAVFTQLFLAAGVGILVFVIISHFLKLEEFVTFKDSLTKKIFKDKQAVVENTDEISGI